MCASSKYSVKKKYKIVYIIGYWLTLVINKTMKVICHNIFNVVRALLFIFLRMYRCSNYVKLTDVQKKLKWNN